MDQKSSKKFYTNLPVLHMSLNQLLQKTDNFEAIPDDWHVIGTDIVNSTEHFESQHYQEINLIAVSCISVVLNIARNHRITIPFIYGGDGATLLIPPALVPECKARLASLRANTSKRFNMDLRVCIIPMSEVIEGGFTIRVAKLFISKQYRQAIFLGDGVRYAESLMKHATDKYEIPLNTKQRPIDLTGLECKWNAIFPPREGDEVVSLIVSPLGKIKPEEVFKGVLDQIDYLYGSFKDRHPVHPKTLSPTVHWKTIVHASHLRYGRIKIRYVIKYYIHGILRSMYTALRGIWHDIFSADAIDISTSSDTLKIDDSLKTVFVGTPENRARLEDYLNEEERAGNLVYGLKVSMASVMTCYIKESQDMHMRFLDGFGGGYTLASIELKKKLAKIRGENK